MGVSGAGKGTQSKLLIEKIGYEYLATGDILRSYATKEQQARMLDGYWLSDAEIIALVDKALKAMPDANKSILDGFPRTLAQAEWLLAQAGKKRFDINAVFNLQVSTDDVQNRLHLRHRVDDTDNAISHRIGEYEHFTRPVISRFKEQGLPVYDIDGSNSPEAVHEAIYAKVKKSHIA